MPTPADRRRPPPSTPTHRAARVQRVDPNGDVYVTPLKGDTAHVIGPCRGGWRRDHSSCPAGAHTHPLVPLATGTIVLLVKVPDDAPWIVAADEHP